MAAAPSCSGAPFRPARHPASHRHHRFLAFCPTSCPQVLSSTMAEAEPGRFVYTVEERELLRALLVKYARVLENRQTNKSSKEAKIKAWDKLCMEYNCKPYTRPRDVKQLKKCWDNEKTRWKRKDSEEKRDIHATGGGPRTCRPMSPSLQLVGALASHMATRLPNPHDSDSIHESQPVLSLPPSAILEGMVYPGRDHLDDADMEGDFSPPASPLQDESNEAEGGASPVREATSLRCTPSSVAPTRTRGGRVAAVEQALAPEKEARLAALKEEQQRKDAQHLLQMRLLGVQMAHQKRRNRLELEQIRHRNKLELELLELDKKIKEKQLAALSRQPEK